MKPVGIYFAISSANREPRGSGIDDDYDWHLRQVASERAAAASTRRPRTTSVPERLRALVRLLRSRPGEPTARRV